VQALEGLIIVSINENSFRAGVTLIGLAFLQPKKYYF
jgi:hypothetical protein